MNAKRLAELKTICDAATPGPWISGDEIGTPIVAADQKTVISAMPICIPEERFTVRVKSVLEIDLEDEVFICAARTALPDLLAEVERLQEIVRDLAMQNHTIEPQRYPAGHYCTISSRCDSECSWRRAKEYIDGQ